MDNAIELPLGEDGLISVIEAVADAMTYEATLALMYSLIKEETDDDLKDASSLFDRLTWMIRVAYIFGVVEGVEVYEAASYEGEFYTDSIIGIIDKMTAEEYSEAVTKVSRFLNISGDIHPVPSIAVEDEECLIAPRRITRRMTNGRITARLDEKSCLEKLWRYENTGFEPEDILSRADRPHIDMMECYKGEPLSGEHAQTVLLLQNIFDGLFEGAYAAGRKAEREQRQLMLITLIQVHLSYQSI